MRLVALVLALAGCDRVFDFTHHPPAPDAPGEASQWLAVDAGGLHACGIKLDRSLWCWGRNDQGQLGSRLNLADYESDVPRQVGDATDWDRVAAAGNTSCAIKLDHSLWCWGENDEGQVGAGTSDAVVADPAQVPGMWASVSVGPEHACAIDLAGAAWCWGSNLHGMLGNGSAGGRTPPGLVAGGPSWLDVSAGQDFTCGLQSDHSLWCWGWNSHGQLGTTSAVDDNPTPLRVSTTTFSKVATGADFACAIRSDGKLRCWGANIRGQLGDASGSDKGVPQVVGQDLFDDWTDLVAGSAHSCARRSGGQILCWGSNEFGELISDPTKALRTSPQTIEDPAAWMQLAAGDNATCLIDAANHLACAGRGAHGDGTGTPTAPVEIASPAGHWDSASAGGYTTCAQVGAELYCWGFNGVGGVGDGTMLGRDAPAQVMGAWAPGVSVAFHSCARRMPTGTPYCWGAGQFGAIGNNSLADQAAPVAVATGDVFTSVAVGPYHSCGITTSEFLFCWGNNQSGEVGPSVANPATVAAPFQVSGSQWKAVSPGAYHTCGLGPAGGVVCFGFAGDGELGYAGAQTSNTTTGVPLPPNTVVEQLTSGERFTCARAGAQAWCWGQNANGQLGDQTTNNALTPRPLPMAWRQLAAGSTHLCGIAADGGLWCWGSNAWGELGDGTFAEKHLPTQVGTDTDWTSVTAGNQHTCAMKGERLFCWGANFAGQVGDGSAWTAKLVMITQ